MPARIKFAVTALAAMFVVNVATYVIQAVTTDEAVLAATYTVAFSLNVVSFVVAYVVLWRWTVTTDAQKRWVKAGLWLAVVQTVASIGFIMVQWTPVGLSDGAITALSLVPMIIYGIENVVVTGFVIWKWNA